MRRMILCVCNAIGEDELRALAKSGARTPEDAFALLGQEPQCGSCLCYAQELIDDGQASHGLLGASVSDAAGDTSVDADVVGAVIKELTEGGAAAQAGLRVGDIVTGVNGVPITSSTDLTAQIRALPGGSEAEIAYVRGGQASTVQVTLGELE